MLTGTLQRDRPAEGWGGADRVWLMVATLAGAGRSPVAPGTAGTLATIPLYLFLAHLASPPVYIAVTLVLLAAGTAAAGRVAARTEIRDPGMVVIDEAVGFLVTMTLVEPSLVAVVLGFLAFRVLDVIKPLGIERLERLPGGYGIMMDDFAAGVAGNVIVRLFLELRTFL